MAFYGCYGWNTWEERWGPEPERACRCRPNRRTGTAPAHQQLNRGCSHCSNNRCAVPEPVPRDKDKDKEKEIREGDDRVKKEEKERGTKEEESSHVKLEQEEMEFLEKWKAFTISEKLSYLETFENKSGKSETQPTKVRPSLSVNLFTEMIRVLNLEDHFACLQIVGGVLPVIFRQLEWWEKCSFSIEEAADRLGSAFPTKFPHLVKEQLLPILRRSVDEFWEELEELPMKDLAEIKKAHELREREWEGKWLDLQKTERQRLKQEFETKRKNLEKKLQVFHSKNVASLAPLLDFLKRKVPEESCGSECFSSPGLLPPKGESTALLLVQGEGEGEGEAGKGGEEEIWDEDEKQKAKAQEIRIQKLKKSFPPTVTWSDLSSTL